MKILGYDWDTIQAVQQAKVRLNAPIAGPASPPLATDDDRALLAAHGIEGLKSQKLFGVIDRLANSGVLQVRDVSA